MGPPDNLQRQRLFGTDIARERSTENLVEVIRRQAIARTHNPEIRRGQNVADSQVASRDQLLAHLQDWSSLAGVDLLSTVAHGDTHPLQITDHLLHPDRLERETMVRTFHRAIQRE